MCERLQRSSCILVKMSKCKPGWLRLGSDSCTEKCLVIHERKKETVLLALQIPIFQFFFIH